ncbi:MAG: BglG family transcription antiterminator [Culicoidibacterales bacterium]
MRQLTERQQAILTYLSFASDWVKGKQMAQIIGVSDRTIRAEIGEIKRKIAEEAISSSKSRGYRYNAVAGYLVEVEACNFYAPLNRFIYICKRLTIAGSVSIAELLETLHISESTLTVDLSKIKKMVETYYALDLELVRIDEMIELHGKLQYKIDFLIAVMHTPQRSAESLLLFFEEFDFLILYKEIKQLLVDEGIELKYYSTLAFVILIAISMEYSLDAGQKRDAIPGQTDFMTTIKAYISNEFTINLSAATTTILQEKLMHLEEITKMEQNIHEQSGEADDLYSNVLGMLEEIKRVFFIDFTSDLQVVKDMTTHIKIALHRIRNGIDIKNVIREELVSKQPLLLDIAIFIANRMYEKAGVLFSADEISFLIIYLEAGYEKINQKQKLKRKLQIVLLVFEGQAVLRYVKNKINGVSLGIDHDFIEVTSIKQVQQLKKHPKQIDLVITTSTRSFFTNLQTITIEPCFSKINELTISQKMKELALKGRQDNFAYIWENYLKNSAPRVKKSFANRYDAIIELSEELIKKGYFNDTYLASVLDRENLFSTGMSNGIAMPHPIKMNATKSALDFTILKQPMNWHGRSIEIIIYFVLSDKDSQDVKSLSEFIAIISNHPQGRARLRHVKTQQELKDVLKDLYCSM